MLPSIIGERAPGLSTLVWYQLLSSAVLGLRPRLVQSLGSGEVEGSRAGLHTRAADRDGRVGIGTEAAV